jgi:putative hemin transport protein
MFLPPDLIDQITNARPQKPKLRERDLAAAIGLSEAHLLAADHGISSVRTIADPQALMPHVCALSEVMALTRNDSAVHERRGAYQDYRAGDHAQMVLGPDIDLRIFPRHGLHAFAVTKETEAEVRRSLQVFDAAGDAEGDAVHKVHLERSSDIAAFDRAVGALRLPDAAPFSLTARAAPESPLTNTDRGPKTCATHGRG